MVVLAGMGAAALTISQGGSGGGHRGPLEASPGTTVSASPAAAAGDIAAAAAAACRAGYVTLDQALSYYQAVNGHPPASMADLARMVRGMEDSTGYTFVLGADGRLEVATAGHPASPGDANCAYAG